MGSVSIADAKARLSELVDRVAGGEGVRITRRGRPVAEIVPLAVQRKRVDIAAVRAMLAGAKRQEELAHKFVRRMRDAAPY